MKTKLFKLIAMFTLASTILTACSDTRSDAVNITIFTGFSTGTDITSREILREIAREYNNSHQDVQIEFTFSTPGEHAADFSSMLSGESPPDIAYPIDVQGITEFYDEWIDVAPYIQRNGLDTNDFYEPSLRLLQYSDKTVGLPIGLYSSVIYYNEDLFDASGIPYPPQNYGVETWTYSELMKIATLLTLDANYIDASSIDFDTDIIEQWGWGGWCGPFRTIPGKFGDKTLGISDDLKQAHMNSDGYLEGMQLLYDSIYTWFIRPSRDEERSTFSGLDFTFESGRVAMFECFSWADDAFSKFSSAGNWDVAAIPAGPYEDIVAPVDADSFAITKHSMNPDLAWSAATWLMQPEIQKRVCEALGCIPSRKSLAEDWVTKMTSQYPNVNFQVFIDSIAYMDASPNSQAWIPNHQKIWSAIENARNRIFGGVDDNVQQAMNRLNTQVQKELDDYWAGHP